MAITLVPQPKSAAFNPLPPVEITPGALAIVIGKQASDPEVYAAELLQTTAAKRFGCNWPIVRENEDIKKYAVLLVLGQEHTSAMAGELIKQFKAAPANQDPGRDAYFIRMGDVNGRFVALVSGINDRAVIYGQDTLFQLFSKSGDNLTLTQATIDDWGSIPWRGRPQASNRGHFVPGRFDSYARARLNWTDLRDGVRSGQYGYPPGHELKVDEVKEIVRESDRRGMFVYATVDCAVRPRDFDAAIGTYRELIELGADGLYISIDDPGAEFRFGTPDELIRRVLDLGREHDMTGRKIGIVPGKESYPKILTDVNRRVAKIPGMEEALWFFTVTPSAQALSDAQSIGMKVKPSWWHNWPRPDAGGLTYGYYGGSRRAGGKNCYMEPPTLAGGWGKASFGELSQAAQHIEAVMPWGGSEWGAEYNSSILGWWAWAPELFNWQAARTRMYDIVFGPKQIAAAFEFDDNLPKLRRFFITEDSTRLPGQLPYLADPATKQDVLDLVKKMRATLAKIAPGARADSLAPPQVLEDYYLEPMGAALDIAETMAKLDFPEHWWKMHEERVRRAAAEGRCEQVQTWIEEAKTRAIREANAVRDAAKPLLAGADSYAELWANRFELMPVVPVLETGPRISGDLSDPIWKRGLKVDSFSMGRSVSPDPTEAYVLATDKDLFVAFLCHEQRMGSLRTRHTARDSEVWMDDSVEIFLNPDMLGDAVYQVVVNAAGHFLDARGGGGRPGSPDWNADVDVKASQGDDRWIAEVRISLESIGVQRSPAGQLWRMNLARNDYAGPFSGLETDNACEVSSWTGQGRFHDASRMKAVAFGK